MKGKKKILLGFSLLVSVAAAGQVLAADRVVVIPLNTGAGASANGVQTVISTTGKVWMDRNLGALRSALASKDSDAYGGLFQWGRLNDGHAMRTSLTTTTLSTSDVPGHGDFILSTVSNFDWKTNISQNNNLWQGVSGTNNPCPAGFRLPTETEWQAEVDSWGAGNNNAAGAFASPLKLVVAGYRNHYSGTISSAGSYGYYWSSTVDGIYSRYLKFNGPDANMSSSYRASGFTVRCLKD